MRCGNLFVYLCFVENIFHIQFNFLPLDLGHEFESRSSLCLCKHLVFLSGVWRRHIFGVLHLDYIVTNLIKYSEWIVADCWQLIWEKACYSERKSNKCRSKWLHFITSIWEGFQLWIIAFVFLMFSTLSRDILEPH